MTSFRPTRPFQWWSHSQQGENIPSRKVLKTFSSRNPSWTLQLHLNAPWLKSECHRAGLFPRGAELRVIQPVGSLQGWSRRQRWFPHSHKELLLDKPATLPGVEAGQFSACPKVPQFSGKEWPLCENVTLSPPINITITNTLEYDSEWKSTFLVWSGAPQLADLPPVSSFSLPVLPSLQKSWPSMILKKEWNTKRKKFPSMANKPLKRIFSIK